MIICLILLSFPLVYRSDFNYLFFRKLRVNVLFFGDNWAYCLDYSGPCPLGFDV